MSVSNSYNVITESGNIIICVRHHIRQNTSHKKYNYTSLRQSPTPFTACLNSHSQVIEPADGDIYTPDSHLATMFSFVVAPDHEDHL